MRACHFDNIIQGKLYENKLNDTWFLGKLGVGDIFSLLIVKMKGIFCRRHPTGPLVPPNGPFGASKRAPPGSIFENDRKTSLSTSIHASLGRLSHPIDNNYGLILNFNSFWGGGSLGQKE